MTVPEITVSDVSEDVVACLEAQAKSPKAPFRFTGGTGYCAFVYVHVR